MERSAKSRDDRAFFEALATGLLTRFEEDPSIPRLILYSALDSHEPPKVTTERQLRVEQPTLDYISKRMRDGAFRKYGSEPRGVRLRCHALRLHRPTANSRNVHDTRRTTETKSPKTS